MNKDYNPDVRAVREFDITTCSACNFCHEIKFIDDVVYLCGITGAVLQQDAGRPVLECEIKKVIIEGEDE